MRHLLLALCLVAGLAGTASTDVKAGVRAYQRGDYATAMRELKPLAEQDNVDAQYHLGEMHLRGRGVAGTSRSPPPGTPRRRKAVANQATRQWRK